MKKKLVQAAVGLFIPILFATSGFAQWTQTTKMSADDSKLNFIQLYSNSNTVFAKTWDTLNGQQLYLTTTAGSSWARVASADSSIEVLSVVMVSSNNLLAGTFNGLYKSTTGGVSWSHLTGTGLPSDTASIWSLTSINDTLYAGVFTGTAGSVYLSTNGGTSWTAAGTGLPGKVRINSMATSGNGLYAGADSEGVFKSTGSPASWTAFNNSSLDSISRHTDQLVAFGPKLFAVTVRGLFSSVNTGTSWTANNLKNVRCLLVANNKLFAGTDSSGVYFSNDTGATWHVSGTGFPAGKRTWSMVSSGTAVFAATTSGIWSAPVSSITAVKRMDPLSGSAAMPCTRLQVRKLSGSLAAIEFSLARPAAVGLDVFDLRGNKVASFAGRKFGAGLQSIPFATGSIASGSHIVRLTADGVVYQQALPILK